MIALVGCSSTPAWSEERPVAQLASIARNAVCPTHGELAAGEGLVVTAPTFRAIAPDTNGNAAELRFTFDGASENSRALASGAVREQLGLKLRAADGCNVIYVMWRTDKRALDVSVKSNPGKRTHVECGADGYRKVRTKDKHPAPALVAGESHALRAEIRGDELIAWIDGHVMWRGTLPDEARALDGPVGVRSDNISYRAELFAEARPSISQCHAGAETED